MTEQYLFESDPALVLEVFQACDAFGAFKAGFRGLEVSGLKR